MTEMMNGHETIVLAKMPRVRAVKRPAQSTNSTRKMAAVGRRVRQAREFYKLTQDELGELIGCSGSHISVIEHGKLPGGGDLIEAEIQALMNGLCINRKWLRRGEGPMLASEKAKVVKDREVGFEGLRKEADVEVSLIEQEAEEAIAERVRELQEEEHDLTKEVDYCTTPEHPARNRPKGAQGQHTIEWRIKGSYIFFFNGRPDWDNQPIARLAVVKSNGELHLMADQMTEFFANFGWLNWRLEQLP